MIRVLTPRLMTQLEAIIRPGLPNETTGLILPDDSVVELPNEAESPHNSFSISRLEIQKVLLSNQLALSLETLEQMTLWHSHPAGGVGPSRIDLAQRVNPMSHLVIAVTDEGLVPTWY